MTYDNKFRQLRRKLLAGAVFALSAAGSTACNMLSADPRGRLPEGLSVRKVLFNAGIEFVFIYQLDDETISKIRSKGLSFLNKKAHYEGEHPDRWETAWFSTPMLLDDHKLEPDAAAFTQGFASNSAGYRAATEVWLRFPEGTNAPFDKIMHSLTTPGNFFMTGGTGENFIAIDVENCLALYARGEN